MSIGFIIGLRLLAYSFFSDQTSDKKVIIYGAGSAGIQLAEALKVSKEMQPIAFLDKNSALHNTYLGGIKILNPQKLRKLVNKRKVDEVLDRAAHTKKFKGNRGILCKSKNPDYSSRKSLSQN